ncbi:MAG: undecaprenyl-diphosphate phosphatase [Actinomycetota bacterium]|nr:undecaprenyl-diphosphate phosphatase [Actinomycetota bacterium]
MNTFQAVFLGVIQGVTEFLPISSTAHLRLVPAFFGWEDPGAAFTAVTQFGTLAAVLIFFREDLWRVALAWLRSLRDSSMRSDPDARMGWYILLGTLPIGICGLIFKDVIEGAARGLPVVATTLILLGLVLLYAERSGRRDRGLESLTLRDGLLIGAAQAMALIPGVSRSGSTLTAGLLLGLERAAAARYSFLLSVPAVVLAGLFELRHIGDAGGGPGPVPTAIATLMAFVSGYASIAFLLRFLANHSTMVFIVYRVALGLLVFALLSAGKLS